LSDNLRRFSTERVASCQRLSNAVQGRVGYKDGTFPVAIPMPDRLPAGDVGIPGGGPRPTICPSWQRWRGGRGGLPGGVNWGLVALRRYVYQACRIGAVCIGSVLLLTLSCSARPRGSRHAEVIDKIDAQPFGIAPPNVCVERQDLVRCLGQAVIADRKQIGQDASILGSGPRPW
jgi:hypothetical protein